MTGSCAHLSMSTILTPVNIVDMKNLFEAREVQVDSSTTKTDMEAMLE